MHVFDHDDTADWFLIKMASVDGLSHHYLLVIESNSPFKQLTFEATWKIFLKPYIFDTDWISERHWDNVIKGENEQRRVSFFKMGWRKTHYYWFISHRRFVCYVSFAKLKCFIVARQLRFSSISSGQRAWSRARFLFRINEPILPDRSWARAYHRLLCALSPITKSCLVVLFQILFYVCNLWCKHCYVTICTKLHQIYITLFYLLFLESVKAGIAWLNFLAKLASKSCLLLDIIIRDQNKWEFQESNCWIVNIIFLVFTLVENLLCWFFLLFV